MQLLIDDNPHLRLHQLTCMHDRCMFLSHPVMEGKPNANYVRARIRNSRTQRLHNWTSSHNARNKWRKDTLIT
jgi:hypothetical protein